jgi:DNA-binding GntR family transcriptional regulator
MHTEEMTKPEPDPQDERGQRSLFAARRLRELIVSGGLAPGQRITERLIAEQLDGVSRTPLREAFKILEAEGLVTIEPNRGAVVTSMSVDEVAAAIEVLIGLESLAAEPACQHITDAEIAAIDGLHQQMESAYLAGELMDYFRFNQAIHQAIVDAARNPVLSRIYAAESARIRRYRYAGNRKTERWQRAVFEHEAILDAVRQRAGPLLREVLRQHHRAGWNVAREFLSAEIEAARPQPVASRRSAAR